MFSGIKKDEAWGMISSKNTSRKRRIKFFSFEKSLEFKILREN